MSVLPDTESVLNICRNRSAAPHITELEKLKIIATQDKAALFGP